MEERILLPAAQRLRGGERLPIAARLRLDHGALAALLVPSATPVPEVAMAPHNDGPGIVEATRRALAKAGYNLEDFVSP